MWSSTFSMWRSFSSTPVMRCRFPSRSPTAPRLPGREEESKSLGNLVFVGDLCKEWDTAAVRLALRGHHYREDWDWRTDEDMPAAAARPALWMSALDEEARPGRSVAAGAHLLGIAL